MASMHDKFAPNSDRMHSREIDDRRKAPDRRLSSRRKILQSGKTFWPNGNFQNASFIICRKLAHSWRYAAQFQMFLIF